MADAREDQVWIVAEVPSVREETGCSLCVVRQLKVVGCCPGVQVLTVRCYGDFLNQGFLKVI